MDTTLDRPRTATGNVRIIRTLFDYANQDTIERADRMLVDLQEQHGAEIIDVAYHPMTVDTPDTVVIVYREAR